MIHNPKCDGNRMFGNWYRDILNEDKLIDTCKKKKRKKKGRYIILSVMEIECSEIGT